MSDNDVSGGEEESLALRRTRRTRGGAKAKDKMAAFEKLKSLKGSKNKYEVKEVENVYDIVDEDTYAKKVNDRLKDDWIDDDGSGYTETGYELFDDDVMDSEESGGGSRKRGQKNKEKKKDKPSKEEKDSQKAGFLSVRDMLSTMPVKRKRNDAAERLAAAEANDGKDDLLEDLLEELNEKKPRTSLSSGQSLFERTKATDRLVSSGRIQEDKKSFASPKIMLKKKKLPVFQVKEEPIDVDDVIAEDHRSFYGGAAAGSTSSSHVNCEEPAASEVIDDFSEDFGDIPEDPVETRSVEAAVEEIPVVVPKQEPQFMKIEDFENFREVDLTTDEAQEEKVEYETESASGSDKILNFYWFDIYEEPRNPGFLYVFGKVPNQGKANQSGNGYSSCCLVLKNVERCMFLLPRDKMKRDESKDVGFLDLYNEFLDDIAPAQKILKFKARQISKKYCFGEHNVPAVSDYMEVRYSGTLPTLPEDIEGNTFSRVFGATSSLLENFLLEKKLKGPSWLQIRSPTLVEPGQQQSWCKMEFTCDVNDVTINPDFNKLPIPPFVVASLTVTSINDANSKRDTILSVTAQINKNFRIQSSITNQGFFHDAFSLINKPAGEVWPFDVARVIDKQTQKMESERQMLNCFLAKMQVYDPDIYVGHDINFDLLLLQLWNHKVPHWSRIGRLKRSSQPQKGSRMPDSKASLAGRLVCDVKISAMELIRARSYDLPSLSMQVLNMNEDQIIVYNGSELKQLFESSDGIRHFLSWGMSLSLVNLRLVNELQVMPLALQITSIAGNTLSRTLSGGRSERNEFLLLHAFYNKGYIVPDKKKLGKRFKEEPDNNNDATKDENAPAEGKSKSGGPSYVGGLVLEPKKGFYDNFIVLMDFNSLYPSIIQEFNVCFTTTTSEDYTDDSERGILPEEIRKLVESRKQVKQLMKADNLTTELKKQYDIRQKALKLTANSMYGCLGFRNSRFYAQRLAALITGKGRDILLKTKDTVEKLGFDVIYGDTDSLMINTNTTDTKVVFQIGNKIKSEINKMYKLLELEIDGIFRFLLLLKKKKYAALLYEQKATGEIETTLELKGLDIVRRDWAPVAAQTARMILDEIMTEQPLDDKIFKIVKILNEKAAELRSGSVPLKELLITKQLAKNPEDYKDGKGLHHVLVAMKMNASGKLPKKFKNGDTVPYLFCTDGVAHHPAELMSSKVKKEPVASSSKVEVEEDPTALKPDAIYYLSNQVHPVVSRICEPIPGLDAARIAESLGLDSSSYKKRRVYENPTEEVGLGEMSDAEKYRECAKFSFLCANPDCRKPNVIETPFVEKNGEVTYALTKCSGGCDVPPLGYIPHIANSLRLFIRKWVGEYYKGWYECEDPGCTVTERAISLHLERGYLVCPCKQGVMLKKYTHADLNKQLNYLLYIFDHDKRLSEFDKTMRLPDLKKTENVWAMKALEELSRIVNSQLAKSSYSEIKLSELFSELMPVKKLAFGLTKDHTQKH